MTFKPNFFTIDATKERHIYQLKLKDSLLNNLNFVKVGHKEIQVAWLRGLLTLCRNYEPFKMILYLMTKRKTFMKLFQLILIFRKN